MSAQKKNNRLALFVFIMVCIIFTDIFSLALADAYSPENNEEEIKVDRRSSIILKDKAGEYHQIIKNGGIKHGVSSNYFSLKKINTSKLISLGGGRFDSERGGCNRYEFLNLEKALVSNVKLEVKLINQDEYFDILVRYKEQDCRTEQKTQITNIFYATENGFQASIEKE